MSIERKWAYISPVTIAGVGPVFGSLTLSKDTEFRVGMEVILAKPPLQDRNLEIKNVNKNIVYLGEVGKSNKLVDVSAYVSGTIRSLEQPRKPIEEGDQAFDRYERGPVNADRVVIVDKVGEYYSQENPLPVTFPQDMPELEVTINGVKLPIIFNIPVANENEEVSISIPQAAKRFLIKVRDGGSRMQLGYTMNGSGTNYITVERGSFYSEDNLELTSSLNLYIQLTKPNQTIEIIYWE